MFNSNTIRISLKKKKRNNEEYEINQKWLTFVTFLSVNARNYEIFQ